MPCAMCPHLICSPFSTSLLRFERFRKPLSATNQPNGRCSNDRPQSITNENTGDDRRGAECCLEQQWPKEQGNQGQRQGPSGQQRRDRCSCHSSLQEGWL